MSEWKPIETAPKDETCILGFDPNADCPIYVIKWFSLNDDTGTGYWIEAGGEEYESWNPTHWMPLPKPPGDDMEDRPALLDDIEITPEMIEEGRRIVYESGILGDPVPERDDLALCLCMIFRAMWANRRPNSTDQIAHV